MRSYYDAINDDYSKYLPLTFHIQNGISDREWEKLVEFYNKKLDEIKDSVNFIY
jgi:tubulin monoglycylase TTLL3/8